MEHKSKPSRYDWCSGKGLLFAIDDRDLIALKDDVELTLWRWQMTEPVRLADIEANVAPFASDVAVPVLDENRYFGNTYSR